MKKVFLFAAAMLYGIVQAQTLHVSFSEKFNLKFPKLFFDHDGHLYQSGENSYSIDYIAKGASFAVARLFNQRYGIELHRYDKNMKDVVKVSFHPERDLGVFLPSLYVFDGHVLLFYYKPSGEDAVKLYFTELDALTLAAHDEQELYAIPLSNVLGGGGKILDIQEHNKLLFSLNPAGTALMVSQSGNVREIFSCVIDRQLAVSGKVVTPIGDKRENFMASTCALDGQGNRYFGCFFDTEKTSRWGVMTVSPLGQAFWHGVGGESNLRRINHVGFYFSKAGAAYVYGNYGPEWNRQQGVMLAGVTQGPNGLTLGDPIYAAYPDTLSEKLLRRNYANKVHGAFYINETSYEPMELADGTIVLTGYVPNHDKVSSSQGWMDVDFMGPIINVFFKGKEGHFGVLYRNQEETEAGGFARFAAGDKLIVVYNESTDNLSSQVPSHLESAAKLKSLVPVQATMSADGRLIERKLLVEREKGINYCTGMSKLVSDKRVIIPRGEGHGGMYDSYVDINQWVTIDLE